MTHPINDPVNPQHYRQHPSGVECIEITKHHSFCIGNAIKYLWRAGQKGPEVEDLRKAIWYIEKRIEMIESAPQGDRHDWWQENQ